MSTPIKIEVMSIINNHVMKQMTEAILFSKKKIDERTPEDKKELIKGNKVELPKMVGSKIVAKVTNKVDHSEIIEFGRGKVMNYHKWPAGSKKKKGGRYVIRRGVGARMYSLTKDLNEKDIISIMKK